MKSKGLSMVIDVEQVREKLGSLLDCTARVFGASISGNTAHVVAHVVCDDGSGTLTFALRYFDGRFVPESVSFTPGVEPTLTDEGDTIIYGGRTYLNYGYARTLRDALKLLNMKLVKIWLMRSALHLADELARRLEAETGVRTGRLAKWIVLRDILKHAWSYLKQYHRIPSPGDLQPYAEQVYEKLRERFGRKQTV